MDTIKIGAITVGQAPRVDVTCDITDIFPEDLQLLEKGGLDGLSREDIEAFAPEEGDYVLVSRLTDGSSVTFAEKHIIGRLQQAIDELQRQGVRLIMIFCTGHFPESLHADVPMIFPDKLLHGVVPAIAGDADLITVTPSPLQVSQNESKWAPYVKSVKCFAGSPYGGIEGLRPVAEQIAAWGRGDLIVLDCIGFTKEMKQMFSQITGKPVILPRTLLARVVCEMISR